MTLAAHVPGSPGAIEAGASQLHVPGAAVPASTPDGGVVPASIRDAGGPASICVRSSGVARAPASVVNQMGSRSSGGAPVRNPHPVTVIMATIPMIRVLDIAIPSLGARAEPSCASRFTRRALAPKGP